MSRVEIPVLRHGRFDGPGAQNRTYGHFVESLTDISMSYPLTKEGKVQIARAAREVAGFSQINLVLSSQFLRARQSAQLISQEVECSAGHRVKIVTTPLLDTIWMPPDTLSEREFYELEETGARTAVADAMFSRWAEGEIGETPTMVQRRIETFIDFLKGTIDAKPFTQPAIVTHASFASALQRHLQGTDLTQTRNEEHILRLAGCYLVAFDGEKVGIDTAREHYLA